MRHTRPVTAALLAASTLLSVSAWAAPLTQDENGKAPEKTTGKTKKPLPTPVFFRSASNSAAPLIRVSVNGSEVNFTNGEPVEAGGAILVPMRGIFEKLGANVAYDSESQTVRAVRGETTITIRPGDASAEVNGEATPLSSPAQVVNGAVVVPLRFVSEALGAQVKWDPDTYAVTVATAALTALQLPTLPGDGAVIGTVTGLYPEASLITVRMAGGENVRVPLVSDVNATRKTLGSGLMINATTETLPIFAAGALRMGEQVDVERNDQGDGLLVLVNTDLRRGELKSIESLPTSGGHQVILTDGTTLTLVPNALITFGNRPVPLDSLKPSEKVAIRLDENGQGISLAVLTPAAPNVIPPMPPTSSGTSTEAMPPIGPPQTTPAPAAPPATTPAPAPVTPAPQPAPPTTPPATPPAG